MLSSHEPVQGETFSHRSDVSVRIFDLRCSCMLPWCIFKLCDQHQEPETVGLTPRCFMGKVYVMHGVGMLDIFPPTSKEI